MPDCTRHTPGLVLFAVPAVGWTLILAVDVVLAIVGVRVTAGLHSVALAAVVTVTVAAAILWAAGVLLAAVAALRARIDDLDPAAGREQPGYAEGFADGLARRPAAPTRHLNPVEG